MSEQEKLTIWYDDTPDKVVDRVNEVLKKHGLCFEHEVQLDDDHEGFCNYNLTKLEG